MKKIGCITFHAAHNYGSCLQAYALKHAFEKNIRGVEYNVINFRNPVQKAFYKSEFEKNDKKSIYSRFFMIGHKNEIKKKHELFESFIKDDLKIGVEIDNIEDLGGIIEAYDTLIAGSDQVWNVNAFEYSEVYFIPYESFSGNRYSYAVSIGSKNNILDDDLRLKISRWLMYYKRISVRDVRTKDFIIDVGGKSLENRIRFDCDPTLLLSEDDWKGLIYSCKIDIPAENYILFYDLSRNKENWDLACMISKKLQIPLLITSVPFPRVIHKSMSGRIKKKMDVGPKEWLALINGADLVLSSSFHGTVFSMIFDKPFYSINTKEDNRVSHFLETVGLTHRIVDKNNVDCISGIPSIREQQLSKRIIERLKKESLVYLNDIVNE